MGVPVVDGGDRSLQREVMSSPGKRNRGFCCVRGVTKDGQLGSDCG